MLKPLRIRALRRLPMTFGLMSKRPIPDELVDQWLAAAGRRLADSFPQSRFVEIPNSRTLIPIDQPRALAGAIATFIGG